MNNQTQTKFRGIYAACMVALMLALLIVSCLPIFSLRAVSEPAEWFANGRYTSMAKSSDGDLPLTLGTAVKVAGRIDDLYTVLSIQMMDSSIETLRDRIREAQSEGASASNLESLQNELELLEGKRDAALAKQTPEQKAALEEKLRSGELSSILTGLQGCMEPIMREADSSSDNRAAFLVGELIYGLLMLICYILFIVLFPICAAIVLLVKLIRCLTHLKNPDDARLKKLSAGKSYGTFVSVTVLFVVLLSAGGLGLVCSGATLAVLFILLALVFALETAKKWILEEQHGVGFAIRQGLTLLSAAAVIVMAFGAAGLHLTQSFAGDADHFALEYQTELAANGGLNQESLQAAKNAVSQKMMLYSAAVSILPLILGVFLWAGTRSLLGGRTATTRFSKKSGTPKFILAVLLLVIVLAIPLFLTSGSVDARTEAARGGQFRVILDPYRVEGTSEYAAHRTALSALEAAQASGDGELIAAAQADVDALETNQGQSLTLCILFGVVFLASEICYAVLPGRFDRKEPETPAEPEKKTEA